MNTVIDGKEQPASLDWEYFSPKEFYDVMRRGERITTTQVPFQEFETEFSKRLEQGYDIVYISCSSALSGSFGAGNVVAKDLMKKYKGRKVFCVDSLNACLGEGILAIKAAEYRDMGLNSAIILSRLVYGDDIPKKKWESRLYEFQTHIWQQCGSLVGNASRYIENDPTRFDIRDGI